MQVLGKIQVAITQFAGRGGPIVEEAPIKGCVKEVPMGCPASIQPKGATMPTFKEIVEKAKDTFQAKMSGKWRQNIKDQEWSYTDDYHAAMEATVREVLESVSELM